MANRDSGDPPRDPLPATRGVLVVGHGTRDERGTGEFLETVQLLSHRLPEIAIEPCFLEIASPSIADGMQRLVARGVNHVTVAPLLLFAAGHAKRDIPAAVADAAEDWPELKVVQAEHLGCHPRVLELSADRFRQAVGDSDNEALRNTLLVMVGRGSQEESALAEMRQFAALRAVRPPIAAAWICFLSMARPVIDETLQQAAQANYATIVVQPHLLFQGELVSTLRRRIEEQADRDRHRRWIVAKHLGPAPAIAAALLDRIRESGDSPCQKSGAPAKNPEVL